MKGVIRPGEQVNLELDVQEPDRYGKLPEYVRLREGIREMRRPNLLPRFILVTLMGIFFFLSSKVMVIGETITAKDAQKFFGETKTVCAKVVGSKYYTRSNRHPTFLNLDQSYPNPIFLVIIWGVDRGKFQPPPEVYYNGKDICVTGKIGTYKGIPEIIVNDPGQIKIK